MTKNVYQTVSHKKRLSLGLVALAGLTGLILGLAGCCSIVRSCLHEVRIVSQPENQVVFANVEATFSVSAVVGPPFTNSGLTYQWQVNTYLLDETNPDANWTNCTCLGATTSSIEITNVQLSDVGYYRVLVTAGGTTVTSATPYLQVITPGSIIVNGTPIKANVTNTYCSGGPFAGYIPYTNLPPTYWGWAVSNTSQTISGTDAVPTANSRVAYIGLYGDVNCGVQTISKSPPIAPPTGSPRYQFKIYFIGTVPSTPRPYPLSITNLY